jgi:mRNA-degrading endonuclease RelE of RelBE toxin-antitoxin system
MTHLTLPRFWDDYRRLPEHVQRLADKNYELLKANPNHPSLHFKKVGKTKQLWSVRVGEHYRALGVEKPDGILWFWIGSHADYDSLLH